MVRSGVIKRFDVTFKGGQLGRSMLALSKKEVLVHFKKKFPKRQIKSIQQK